jgi:hypothetical protein
MRLLAIALLIGCTTALHAACATETVWIAGHWGNGACGPQWVQGCYTSRPVTTVVVSQPVIVVPPPPVAQVQPAPPVWVPGGWAWAGDQWVWRDGYWSMPPGSQPAVCQTQPSYPQAVVYQTQPVCQPQPVYVQQTVCEPARPRVSIDVGVGFGYGGYRGYRRDCDDDRHHGGGHISAPPIPFVPGSHVLSRPPKGLPDPLGIIRHDPLGLFRK